LPRAKPLFALRLTLLLAPLLVLGAAQAYAHAFLDHASPLVGSTVRTAPREVVLWFTETIEPAFSRVTVQNASGARVDRGSVRASGNQLRVSLGTLGPGTYRVVWRVVSVDTHATEGDFTFRVGE
jgi:methionine-rich copper-binding protein CopC